jgi:hypothetical protein
MKPEVLEKLEELRAPYLSHTYQAIRELGWNDLDRVTLNKEKYEPAVWSELRPDGKVLLVVQLKKWVFLRTIGSTDCIGFLIDQDNNIELVDENYLMEEIGHP